MTLLSDIFALICNTKSTVVSALIPSSVNCRSPFILAYSILFSCTSPHSSGSVYTPSKCLCNSLCHSSLSSVNVPLTYNSVWCFLLTFFFPGVRLQFTKLSAPAFLACLLSTLHLITFVHLAAASSRILTSSGVLRKNLLSIFVQCATAPAARSIPFLYCDQFFTVFFILHHLLHEFKCFNFCLGLPPRPILLSFPGECFSTFSFLYPRINRVVVPRVPQLILAVNVCIIGPPSRGNDVVQL